MDFNAKVEVRAWDIPIIRQQVAVKNKVDRNLAFLTYGGLGDVLCCEPTIRYACEVLMPGMGLNRSTVVTRYPDLFRHLPVNLIQAGDDGKIEIDGGVEKYHFVYCGHPEGNLQHHFFTHNSMMPVDFPALSALRMQLPLNYRYIKSFRILPAFSLQGTVVVHPGNHWASKRFPKRWWDSVINNLIQEKFNIMLIGGKPGAEHGTVEVDTDSDQILDFRERLSLPESAGILKEAQVLLTNDSFPLHLATTGGCHIGFLATAKDPEWLYHWRNSPDGVQFGWRMQNLAKGGAYQRSFTPKMGANHLSEATQDEVRSWLPSPESVASWAADRM